MAWRDDLRTVRIGGRTLIGASFRGIPFLVESAEMSGGRRTVSHEYPFKDEPFVEDMGRSARGFPIEGYVLGADYVTQQNALIEALEKPGVGELIHPYFGARKVICGTFRVRNTRDDGGMAVFSLDFQETPAQPIFPTADDDAGAKVEDSADAAMDGSGDEYLDQYDVERAPQYSLDSIANVIQSASTALDSALAPIVAETQALADLKRQLDGIYLDADSLVRQPFKVVSRFTAVFTSLFTLPATPSLNIKALLRAYGFTPDAQLPPPTTATRRKELVNFQATQALVQRMTIVQAAKLAPIAVFDSFEDATATREQITTRLDDQMEVADDTLFPLLQQLRADLVVAVPGTDHRLARLLHHTPPGTIPSLALAYKLYGDVSREGDIVTRNRVRRPGFVPGGRELEILSRV